MNATQIATAILTLVAGIGIFLIACSMMSSNLEALGSKRLKSLFAKASKSKLLGVCVGTVTTAAIQSSSATSVMVIGFVNAGIMTLAQAATVIFGANIGTTITGQLVALGMFGDGGISTSVIFATFAGIGAFILAFAKKDAVQKTGGIMAGFGMLFVGLSMMSGAMSAISELDSVKNFLAVFKNPIVLVLIGTLMTAIVQSSSVMTSMAITMVLSGLISLNQGIYLTMGSNIGTCVTALIAGLTSTKNAKRTALIHLIFNVSGVIVFLLIGLFMSFGGINYGWLFEKMFPHAPQMQLAMFHTIFNLLTVVIVLPLTNPLVKLVTKIVPDRPRRKKSKNGNPADADMPETIDAKPNEPRLFYADTHMLATPPIAVAQVKREIINMADIAIKNFDAACRIVCSLDYAGVDEFLKNEETLDFINRELSKFTAKLLKADLNEKDRLYLSTAFRSVSDLERIGDYAENMIEYADKLKAADERFTDDAIAEITELQKLIAKLYENVCKAYADGDRDALAAALRIEESVDFTTNKMTESHIARMTDGKCSPEVGAQFLSLTAGAERIADHLINVAKTIKSYS